MKNFLELSFFLLLSSLIPCCQLKQGITQHLALKNQEVPVFLEIPKNTMVFENLSPLVYDVMHAHLKRIGYKLVDSKNDGYTLQITIKDLSPSYKYVSPDVLLFHATIRLELSCNLLNYGQKSVIQKKFTFSTLLSKPQNPIINSDFSDFEYTKLLEKAAPKIEQFFRPYLLKSIQ